MFGNRLCFFLCLKCYSLIYNWPSSFCCKASHSQPDPLHVAASFLSWPAVSEVDVFSSSAVSGISVHSCAKLWYVKNITDFPRPFQDLPTSITFSCFGTACCRLENSRLWVECLSWWVVCDTLLKTDVWVCRDGSVWTGFYYGKHSWPLKSKGHIYEWLSLLSVQLKITVHKQKPKHTSPM